MNSIPSKNISLKMFLPSRALLFFLVAMLVAAAANAGSVASVYGEEDSKKIVANATVYLRNGGEVTGFVELADKKPKSYLVYMENGTILKFLSTKIKRIDYYSEKEQNYLAKRHLVPDTVEAHWNAYNMIDDDKEISNRYREYHLRKIIQIDPDEPEARRKLGYRDRDGEWILTKHWMSAHGLIQDPIKRGEIYLMPQDIELRELKKKQKKALADFRNEIQRLRKQIKKNGKGPLRQFLAGVKDPMAVSVLADLIKKEKEEAIQLLYVETIGQIKSGAAVSQLAALAIAHPSQLLREHCVVQLKKEHYSRSQVVNALIPFLNPKVSKDNLMIRRAGFAIGEVGDESAIKPLISALVTSHMISEGGGAGRIGVGQNSAGGGGLNVGGNNKPKFAPFKNPEVHQALRRLAKTNVDHEYNQMDWINWYISRKTITSIDLRRDD